MLPIFPVTVFWVLQVPHWTSAAGVVGGSPSSLGRDPQRAGDESDASLADEVVEKDSPVAVDLGHSEET